MIAKRAFLILFSIFLIQKLSTEELLSYLNRILSSTEQSLDKSYRRLATGTYLLADNILKRWFQGEKYYQTAGVDRLLDFFLRQRIIMGTLVKTLESRTRSLALNAENLMTFQKSLWDIDMAKEISRLRKHHLLFIINLLLL